MIRAAGRHPSMKSIISPSSCPSSRKRKSLAGRSGRSGPVRPSESMKLRKALHRVRRFYSADPAEFAVTHCIPVVSNKRIAKLEKFRLPLTAHLTIALVPLDTRCIILPAHFCRQECKPPLLLASRPAVVPPYITLLVHSKFSPHPSTLVAGRFPTLQSQFRHDPKACCAAHNMPRRYHR